MILQEVSFRQTEGELLYPVVFFLSAPDTSIHRSDMHNLYIRELPCLSPETDTDSHLPEGIMSLLLQEYPSYLPLPVSQVFSAGSETYDPELFLTAFFLMKELFSDIVPWDIP